MNNLHPILNKRKGFLFACLLLSLPAFFSSCKKTDVYVNENPLGNSMEGTLLDTLSFETISVIKDSVVSSNRTAVLLGSYVDPVFGKVSAGFYTQVRLPVLTDFTFDVANIHIDSMVLSLAYSSNYGNDVKQKFEIYQMNEQIYLDSLYYNFSKKDTVPGNLMLAGKDVFQPNPYAKTVVDTSLYDPLMRLHLDTNFARQIMVDHNSQGILASNDVFTPYFKGLYVKVNNPSQASGKGAVYGFNLAHAMSKMTIYYRTGTNPTTQKFDFLINSNCADFTSLRFDNSNSKLMDLINNPSLGKNEFFIQSGLAEAYITIPGLDSLPERTIIHTAKLTLPVNYHSLNPYFPSTNLDIYAYSNFTKKEKVTVSSSISNVVTFDNNLKQYSLNLQGYIQSIVSKTYLNTGIYLSSSLFDSKVERIMFNGVNTTNKNKPKLVITYTTF